MDKILGNFVVQHIDQMNISDLLDLEKLLNIDDNNLYNYYNNLETDIKFDINRVNTLFKNFKFKKINSGGETGIRTQERVAPLPVFKTGAFNRSAISP